MTLTYNGADEAAAVTDPVGRTVSFDYDGAGLLASVTTADGRSVSLGYASGRRTSVTDVRGGVTPRRWVTPRVTTTTGAATGPA